MKRSRASLFGWLCLLSLSVGGCKNGSFFSPITEVSPDNFPVRVSSRLVVGCFISPQDTVVRVSVTETTPLYDTLRKNPVVSGARVVLSNAQKDSIVLVLSPLGFYQQAVGKFRLVAGQTYNLTVSAPDGRWATASCQIPALSVPIQEMRVDSGYTRTVDIGNPTPDSTLERYAYIRWRDIPGPNYYRVYGVLEQTESVPTATAPKTISFNKLLYFSDENNRSMIVSDRNRDQQSIQSANGVYWRGTYLGTVLKQKITMYLLNTDKNYFDYYESIATYQEAAGNPFAEPAPISTNIVGGLGCFAGYNGSRMTLVLR